MPKIIIEETNLKRFSHTLGEIGCDFAPIPYKHSSFPDIPFGMPDFKLFCFQPLKSMLSLMKKDDSPFFRSESCNEAY